MATSPSTFLCLLQLHLFPHRSPPSIYNCFVIRCWVDSIYFFVFFSVSYVEERPWWPIKSLSKRRKEKAKRRERSDQVY